MSHVLYRIGNFAGRHPWRVISAWVFVALAIFMFNSSSGGQYDESFSLLGASLTPRFGRPRSSGPHPDPVAVLLTVRRV
jgi:hypothetical protein